MIFQTLSSIAGNLSLTSFGARTLSNCVPVFHCEIFFFMIEVLLRYCQLVFLIALSFFLKIGLF